MTAIKRKKSPLSGDRFEDLVHHVCYIAGRSGADKSKLSAVKLNKILWYIDTIAYRKWGESLSGETAYIKRQYGPVPRNILKTLENLKKEGRIEVETVDYYGNLKREFISSQDPSSSTFRGKELDLIIDVTKTICDEHSAHSISELSHDTVWRLAQIGEEIPIDDASARESANLTRRDMEWVDEPAQGQASGS